MQAAQVTRRLIILDRDGVLNGIVVDAEHGTINSPMNESQVKILDGVPEALKKLCDLGYDLRIATNQPAAAKGLTSKENLDRVHARVLELAQARGAKILSSHICFHRSEDNCTCRKPKPGLLLQALQENPNVLPQETWMIGDGVTDVEAARAAGVRAGFLGPKKCDACKILRDPKLNPEFWGTSLAEFVSYLEGAQP